MNAPNFSQLSTMLSVVGLPAVLPEPEALAADLARIQAKSLARIIAALVNANEPLLKAEADGATVTVSERGGGAVMHCCIDASPINPRGAREVSNGLAAEQAAGTNHG